MTDPVEWDSETIQLLANNNHINIYQITNGFLMSPNTFGGDGSIHCTSIAQVGTLLVAWRERRRAMAAEEASNRPSVSGR